jgi:hypothetical protein
MSAQRESVQPCPIRHGATVRHHGHHPDSVSALCGNGRDEPDTSGITTALVPCNDD